MLTHTIYDHNRLFLLVFLWLLYFGLHSLLASLWLKRYMARTHPNWMPSYRILFNLCATVLLLPPVALTYWERGPWLWEWTGPGWWVANGLAAAALIGLLWSLRWYDGAEFLGLKQLRNSVISAEDQESFHISPLHRFVRHPWYSLGLVLIWTRDMDPAFLTTALMSTLYVALGSRLEERKLLVYHGEVYRSYRWLVPSLIPLPWRYLTREQSQALATGAAVAVPVGRR